MGHHQRPRPTAPLDSSSSDESIESTRYQPVAETDRLVRLGVVAGLGRSADSARIVLQVVRDLDVLGRDDLIDAAFVRVVPEHLGTLWERGWSPLDVVHAVQHDFGRVIAALAAEIVLADARLQSDQRPPEWDRELEALRARRPRRSSATGEFGKVLDRFRMVEAVVRLPAVVPTLTAPSAWGTFRPTAEPVSGGAVDGRVLERVRALLAKAESTTFEAEADAFMSKAQELMARHAIDMAMLQANDPRSGLAAGVRARRVHIDDPYAPQKAQLLAAVASVNDATVVWHDPFGFATVVGFPVELDLIELTFTSLLVQMTRAMTAATSTDRSRTRAPAFRRAFVLSYAQRIGERLAAAKVRATAEATEQYGGALVPLQQARRDAVDTRSAEWFPRLREMRTRSVDAGGWWAGRQAADLAHLGPDLGELR
jgi:hypothetical protein